MFNNNTVLIVGRPNVGKSSFINRLRHQQEAITAEEAGVTRDVKEYDVDWIGVPFKILDSGGMILEKDRSSIQAKIDERVQDTLNSVDHIVFMVDGREGPNPLDYSIAKLLRVVSDKVVLAVNKIDVVAMRSQAIEFYKLGFGNPFPVSAEQGLGVGDLLDHLVGQFQTKNSECDEDTYPKLAIVGRPNIGKSSLTNTLTESNRVIVHNEPGTTRDTIYVPLNFEGLTATLIDTAGLRRRTKITDDVEYYSTLRTDRAMDEADLIIFLMDMTELLTDLDKKIFHSLREKGKSIVFFINKCDLLDDEAASNLEFVQEYLYSRIPQLSFYPVIMGSVIQKKGLRKLVQTAKSVLLNIQSPLKTALINRIVLQIVNRTPPPSKMGKRLNIFYVTVVKQSPLTLIWFVNDPAIITEQYERFLEKQFRNSLPELHGIGLVFVFKKRR